MINPQEKSTAPTLLFSQNECGHSGPTFAKRMCSKCYGRARTLERNPNATTYISYGRVTGKATCHPERNMFHGDGLCKSCYRIKHLYGADFLAMYLDQAGRCKCCDIETKESLMRTDHNHETMMVRGLLCHTCNILVGFAEHPNLDLALAYLKANDG
jgi:hypothetical protein